MRGTRRRCGGRVRLCSFVGSARNLGLQLDVVRALAWEVKAREMNESDLEVRLINSGTRNPMHYAPSDHALIRL